MLPLGADAIDSSVKMPLMTNASLASLEYQLSDRAYSKNTLSLILYDNIFILRNLKIHDALLYLIEHRGIMGETGGNIGKK